MTVRVGALARRVVACVLVLGWALSGCSPAPPPFEWPSETGTPTPTWDAEQARAIEAVQRYIQVWSEIGQNVDTADWNRVYEVATGVEAEGTLMTWTDWAANGFRLVGEPVITVVSVTLTYVSGESRQYYVRTCYDRTNAHLVDSSGNQIEGTLPDQFPHGFTVAISLTGPDLVIDELMVEGSC